MEFGCPKCGTAWPTQMLNADELAACAQCGSEVCLVVFPAALRDPEKAQAGETIVAGDVASCFYHPGKKAATACDACGRFLCTLCDVSLVGGEHLCPACVETGKKKGRIKNLNNRRTAYDRMALNMALLPLAIPYLGWFATVATAPAAIIVAIRFWKAPLGITTRTRLRFWVAIIVSLIEIGAWATLLIFLLV